MSKPLILVVDDDKNVSDSIAETIRGTGRYEAIAAYSGKEALDQLSKHKKLLGLGGNDIRFVFLDIKMSEMDGLQVLEKIRKDYGENIGVSMLTAYEDEEKWDKATSGFVVNYIRKPYKDEEVIETLDKFFAGKESEMTIKTFEKHIAKKEEWGQKRPAV